MFNVFAGGAVSRMAIFALGIMPYIFINYCSIAYWVSDYFKNLKAQGETGRAKITQITRYEQYYLPFKDTDYLLV